MSETCAKRHRNERHVCDCENRERVRDESIPGQRNHEFGRRQAARVVVAGEVKRENDGARRLLRRQVVLGRRRRRHARHVDDRFVALLHPEEEAAEVAALLVRELVREPLARGAAGAGVDPVLELDPGLRRGDQTKHFTQRG